MKVFGLSEIDFLSFLKTCKEDISPAILTEFHDNFKNKDSAKFIKCLSSYLVESSDPLKVAACFSPILLSCFKKISNKLELFLLLSKLCSQFECARTYLYGWISVSGDYSKDGLIASAYKKKMLPLMEAYYKLLHYDTTFFKRHLPIGEIMILYNKISDSKKRFGY